MDALTGIFKQTKKPLQPNNKQINSQFSFFSLSYTIISIMNSHFYGFRSVKRSYVPIHSGNAIVKTFLDALAFCRWCLRLDYKICVFLDHSITTRNNNLYDKTDKFINCSEIFSVQVKYAQIIF